jgi:hypothetical protein
VGAASSNYSGKVQQQVYNLDNDASFIIVFASPDFYQWFHFAHLIMMG